jgi:hypothetical protein
MKDQATTSTELLSLIITRRNELSELKDVAEAMGGAEGLEEEIAMYQDIYCLTESGLRLSGEEV